MPSIANPRDSEACSQIRYALENLGYRIGDSILNYPAKQKCFDLFDVADLTSVDVPFLQGGDVIVQATRPPLTEGHQDDKKKIEPSNTTLERLLFLVFWRYIRLCSRSYVVLTQECARHLPNGMENRAEMSFLQWGCRYTYLAKLDSKRSRRNPLGDCTAGFLLRVDEIFPGGPGLVAAWGQNAHATLAWCTQLRHRYPDLLESRGLTIVDLHPQPVPERPSNHLWALDWKVTPVMEMGVELPPRPEEAGLAIAL
jgi:hypothetical protein